MLLKQLSDLLSTKQMSDPFFDTQELTSKAHNISWLKSEPLFNCILTCEQKWVMYSNVSSFLISELSVTANMKVYNDNKENFAMCLV